MCECDCGATARECSGAAVPWLSPRCRAAGRLSNRGTAIQELIAGHGCAVTASGIAAGDQTGPLAVGLGRAVEVSRSPGQGLPIAARDVCLTRNSLVV